MISKKAWGGLRVASLAMVALLGVTLAIGVARADDVSDGDRALRQGRADDAMRYYEKAARAGFAGGHAGVGRVWLRRGQSAKAMESFRRAVEVDPRLAMGWYGQAEVLKREGKCAESIPLYEKATGLDRKFPEAQLGLGNCLVAVGRIDEGIAALNQGMKWGREWEARFLVARGAAYTAQQKLREAGIDFVKAREIAPNDPTVRRAIGDFYIQRGTWALAIPELEAALSSDPNDVEAQYSLAQALYFNQEYEKALEAYRRVTTIDSTFAPGQLGLGNLLFQAGAADPKRYAQAHELLERYTRLNPEDAKGWSLLGRTYFHIGRRDEAMTALQRAEQLGDETKDLYTTLGKLYVDRKDWDRAIAAFEKGEPGPKEWALIGQVYEVAGKTQQADSMYRAILERDSTSSSAAIAYSQLAKARFRAKDYAGARALFDRSLAIDPKNGDAHFYRGLSLRQLNENGDALAAFQKAVELDPDKSGHRFWLGVLLDLHKRNAEAEPEFLRAIELAPNSDDAAKSHRQLGYYRLMKKQWKAAVDHLERSVALDPDDSQGWLWLAQGHQNSGNRSKAAECYRRVLQLDPDNVHAKKGLQVLQASR